MDKRGFTTESGGRQNGFAIEPEIKVLSEGESKKSNIIFSIILIIFISSLIYFFKFNLS
tara:strand:+ start:1473 stop:1649 length:177 start_codon:yes stop_codon:yes gene_type:complete